MISGQTDFFLLQGWTFLYVHFYYNLMEISFYKQHARVGRVCMLGGVVMHNAERTSHSASAIVAKGKCMMC